MSLRGDGYARSLCSQTKPVLFFNSVVIAFFPDYNNNVAEIPLEIVNQL